MSRSAARAPRSSRAKERAGMCGPWRLRPSMSMLRSPSGQRYFPARLRHLKMAGRSQMLLPRGQQAIGQRNGDPRKRKLLQNARESRLLSSPAVGRRSSRSLWRLGLPRA